MKLEKDGITKEIQSKKVIDRLTKEGWAEIKADKKDKADK